MSAEWQLMLERVDPEGRQRGATQTSGPTTEIDEQTDSSITISRGWWMPPPSVSARDTC
jgi:hypothetical protein